MGIYIHIFSRGYHNADIGLFYQKISNYVCFVKLFIRLILGHTVSSEKKRKVKQHITFTTSSP